MADVRDPSVKDAPKEWKPDNEAEIHLMKKADQAFELFVQSLTAEVRKILLEE